MKIKTAKLYGMLLLLTSVKSTVVFGATDITGHWAEKTIMEWQDRGKISGYEDDTFRPNASITRAEFIHLLSSIIILENSAPVHFNDVMENDWFYQDVIKAAGNHIIAGFEDNTFHPNEIITRAQAALIIKNVLQLPDTVASVPITDDAEIPDWAKAAIYTMLHTGYLSGYEDGSFAPNKSMTRAEAVSMLSRIEINQNTNESLLSTNQNTNEVSQNTNQNQNSQNTNLQNHSKNTVWERDNSTSSYKTHKRKEEEKKSEEKQEILITKDNVADFYGKTLEDNVKIVINCDNLELLDMTLNGKTEIIFDNSETIFTEQTSKMPILFLKGSTKIKDMIVSAPIMIKSENNVIETLTVKEKITISGNTNVVHLKCLEHVEKEKNISICLEGNVNCNIEIPESIMVENIHLSEQAQAHIVNKGILKELYSFSQHLGTTVINHGVIDSLIALNTETITAENIAVEPAVLQSITVLFEPSQLHYKEGEHFSLSGISLFLQYQNNITKVMDKIEDFYLYHIQTIPENNMILTAKEDKKEITILGDNVSTMAGLLEVEHIQGGEDTEKVENEVNREPLSKLIQDCKMMLQDTIISDTGKDIALGKYYINQTEFHLFETEVILSEEFLLKQDITQKDVQQQCDKLQLALQNFQQKRTSQMIIQPPILSVSNTKPEYDENVIFTIDKKENTRYYYTLDGSEPSIESTEYIEEVILFHPEDTHSVTIKVIAIENEVSSSVVETTVVYPMPIESVFFSDFEVPSIGKEVFEISLEEQTKCEIEQFCWKNGEVEVDYFEGETVYSVDIILKAADGNYFFESTVLENLPEEKIIDKAIERIDIDKLHVVLTFEATPHYPTEEMAKEKLGELAKFSVLVDASKIKDEEYCTQIISECAQEKIGKDWIVTFEPRQLFLFGPLEGAFSGTFTITSVIDDSIWITAGIDVTIKVEDDKER